jgi:hypothetical protein
MYVMSVCLRIVVSNIYCVVFFVLFFVVLPVSLDCSLLIASSVFSYVYLL